MIRCHGLIRLPSKPHHRVIKTVERTFAAVGTITLVPHRDEEGVVWLDIAGELLRLDGDAFRGKNPVRLRFLANGIIR
ncbi:hypothetical protein EP10_000586 [Geobacillus icigianus]|uniref:Uncharacterized protein n=1 Tax=Geobacillus icigianus TaxID=1430331 RepID=A0ABU6BD40_9BACL|nr:hypothetical protein [Geobacillus icigianus]